MKRKYIVSVYQKYRHIKVSAFKCVQISNNSIFKKVLLHIFITLLGRTDKEKWHVIKNHNKRKAVLFYTIFIAFFHIFYLQM